MKKLCALLLVLALTMAFPVMAFAAADSPTVPGDTPTYILPRTGGDWVYKFVAPNNVPKECTKEQVETFDAAYEAILDAEQKVVETLAGEEYTILDVFFLKDNPNNAEWTLPETYKIEGKLTYGFTKDSDVKLLIYDEGEWAVKTSELDAEGVLTWNANQETPYAVVVKK